MKIKVLLFFLLTFCSQWTFSQASHPCLYELGIDAMEQQYPGYAQSVRQTFENVKKQGHNRSVEVYTIPVVFHVVWKENEENIPDAKIYEQLDELNRCYRRLNPDTSNLREVFLSVAGDPGIEFKIADIKRVKTNKLFEPTFFSMPDGVKQSANGGSDAIDPYHFLNIWICKLQPLNIILAESPVLGYAYPPDSLANWPEGAAAPSPALQGVVLDYRTIGTGEYEVQGIGSLPMKGRTAVHEIGHYLGLRHISGDGSLLIGVNCDASDGVDDTPKQGKQSEFVCDQEQNTCDADMPGDLPDMIENYMDYSTETCQNTFTQGQIDIMRAVLEGPRAGLVTVFSSNEDLRPTARVTISPNPSTGVFHIQSKLDVRQITVVNSLGKVVVVQQKPNDATIDLSVLPAGIYWLAYQLEDGTAGSEKVVRM
jgi:hypothetical protein